MKRKFSKILGVGLTLALLFSLLLTAAPVSADVSQPTVSLDDEEISAETTYSVSFKLGEELPASTTLETSGAATAEWITNAPAGYTGTHCVELTAATGWSAARLAYGETLATLVGHTDTKGSYTVLDVAFNVWATGDTVPFAVLWIDEDADGTLDTQLSGGFDVQADGTVGFADDFLEWVEMYKASTADWMLEDYAPGVTTTYTGDYDGDVANVTLSEYLADPDCADAEVGYVGVGYWDNPDLAYVDDIIINGNVVVGDTITITFPEDTVVPAGITGVTIQASPGWIDGQWENARTGDVTFASHEDDLTVTATLGAADVIGEGATVRIEVPGIINPDEPGDYTLEVSTSAEDELVESEPYTIEVPDVGVLPGVVELYNPNGILMDSATGNTAIQAMLNKADEGWSIKIGEGEYADDIYTDANDVTIEGDGDVEDTIIEGTWTIAHEEITIDGLTLDGGGANNVIVVTGIDFTLEDCVLEDADGVLLLLNADDGAIEDCTFTIEDGVGIDVIYDVDPDDTETTPPVITDCTFTVEEDGDGVGIEINADIELTGCTFNGGNGVGVAVNDGVSAIEGCTFDVLETAFIIDGDLVEVDIFGGTIMNCEEEAIIVTKAATVLIHNNTITGNDEAVILDVAGDVADKVFMMFNTITDNDGDDDGLLINNTHTDGDLVVANNWWGDPDGPGDDAFSDDVEAEPFLAGPITSSALEADLGGGETADFEDACNVQVDNDSADGTVVDIIAAAQYTTNPVAAIGDAVGFWDVCMIGDVDQITLRIYTDVTKDTELWVWGEARGEWLQCDPEDAKPNLFGGFMWVKITDTTTPTLDDLAGLPFAVVEPAAEAGEIVAPIINAPVSGADDISLTPTFAWSPGKDADGEIADAEGYYFELADNANFVLPLVKLDGDTGRLIVTAYAYVGELPYSSAYYWRVRAVTGTVEADDLVEGDWASAVFITMDEPVEPTPPVEIVEAPELPDITITQPDITITSPDIIVPLPAVVETAITPSWIYVIIAVGGVLVTALLVLIIRTRRVA